MRLATLACAVLLALLGAASAAAADLPPLVPRELSSLRSQPYTLLRLAPDATAATKRRVRAAGGRLVSLRLQVWQLTSVAATALLPRLAVAGALLDAEPDQPRVASDHVTATDPLLPREWWIARVGADRAEPPGPGKPVGVVDSGLDVAHPEFADRPNTVLLSEQSTVGRREFHGTAVASVAGAPANGVGLVGVYPSAVLLAYDASPTFGLRSSDVVAGIEAAAARGPAVINLSLGGEFRSRVEEAAVLDAFARGSLVVAAAGNERVEGNPPSYPASLPHVITVAGTDGLDEVASFSSRIPGIDIAAPAESIPVAVPSWYRESGYDHFDGTSFSSPIVAGAAAWIWTVRPELDATQVVELLRLSARDVGTEGRDRDTGFGMLDIPRALTLPAPPRDPSEPNDTASQVRLYGRGGSAAPQPSLTTPTRGRGSVVARLDSVDDPADVYRAWIPARGRVVVSTPVTEGLVLGVAGSERPLRSRRGVRGATAFLELTSRSAFGGYAFIRAGLEGTAAYSTYRLAITTARARR